MPDVTRLLQSATAGNYQAAAELLPVVYDELRKLAAVRLEQEQSGQTLQPTALVHEAYLRLVGNQKFEGRGHFFAAAAEAMRRILINRARDRGRIKRGGDRRRIELNEVHSAFQTPDDELLELDDALNGLAAVNPQCAELVKLRFFAGFTHEEAANLLALPRRSADRLWAFARSWLYDALDRA